MFNKIGNLIQYGGIIGIITRFHFYDTVNHQIQFNLLGMFGVGVLVYFAIVRKYVKVQKSREFDEAKSGKQTLKVQTPKLIRNSFLLGLGALTLIFLGDTLYNLGITFASCCGVYSVGGSIKLYDLSKKEV